MLIDVENLDMKICYPTQSPGNENVDMSHQEATVKKSDDTLTPAGKKSDDTLTPAGKKSDDTLTPADKKSDDTWTKSPTLLLIDEYRKAKHLLENGKIRKNSLWRSISNKLRKQGYTFTDSQVCGRWKTLCRGYKDVKDGRRKSGSGRKDCPYFTELDQILGKDPAVTPSCTVSSLKEASQSVLSCDESSSSSAQPRPSENEDTGPKPVSCVKKARKTQAAEVVQFLQSYVAQQDTARTT